MTIDHEPSYDGLRAVAIGAVLTAHASHSFPGSGLGVEIFFALSGYLITRILLGEEARTGSLKLGRFYYRRALRLMPALVALVVVVMVWAGIAGRFREWSFPAIMALTYLMNFNRAFAWGPQDPLGHTWSLAMEEQFYLLWPLVLVVVPIRRRAGILGVAIVAICGWRGWLLLHGAGIERVYNGLDTHSEILLMGCLLAVIEPTITGRARQWATRAIAVPIAGIAVQMLLFDRDTAVSQGIGNIVVGVLACWLIIALPLSNGPRRLLSFPPMRFVGRISYGIYLWHYPLFQFGGELAIPHWRSVAVPLSILMATISYYTIERRFLRLRDRLRPPGTPADLADADLRG